MSTYSDDQILEGISRALVARDMPGVVNLLRMLAVQAPGLARQIVDAAGGKLTVQLDVTR